MTTPTARVFATSTALPAWGRAALGTVLGATTVLAIFWTVARFDLQGPLAVDPAIDDLHAVAMVELPPPPPEIPRDDTIPPDVVLGLERMHSESPVQVTVPPPELEALLPPPDVAPPATIDTRPLYLNVKPKIDEVAFGDRIYQMAEVDQIPKVLHRVYPTVPASVRNGAPMLRATFLFVVEADGSIKNFRLAASSGNPEFDAIINGCIRDWTFTPAVKRGRKVRCLLQQAVTVKWDGSRSRFSL